MFFFIQTLLFLIGLMLLHELGHIIAASYLRLKIKKVGFKMKPYPHFFVAVLWPRTNMEKHIYLFSGIIITLSFLLLSLYFNFFHFKSLIIAFIIQITIETNPFYSDITIAIISSSRKIKYGKSYGLEYKQEFSNHQFTKGWYTHFIIWTILIILLIKFIFYYETTYCFM